ncbi:MAG TPA: hypothetical protein PLI51_11085, partial [bacterium]|nr:hypothetical protein [bacterium]
MKRPGAKTGMVLGAAVLAAALAVGGGARAEDLRYSTYLGGSDYELFYGLAVAPDGAICVTGITESINFPTVNPVQPGLAPGYNGDSASDGFVALFSSDGSSLIFSTYLGGDWKDFAYDAVFTASGEIVVTGSTQSYDFPTLNSWQSELSVGSGPRDPKRAQDIFITRFASDGSSLVFSTYFGGIRAENNFGRPAVALQPGGEIVIGGVSVSGNFPTIDPYDGSLNGGTDMVVARFDSGGTPISSTFFGGESTDNLLGLAVGTDGSVYLAGQTTSDDFPTCGAYMAANPADEGILVGCLARLDSSCRTLLYGSYFGGHASFPESVQDIAVDSDGAMYILGYTKTDDFPTANPYQAALAGAADAYVAKFSSDGSTLIYSTYLGGNDWDGNDDGTSYNGGIDVDPWGRAYVTALTKSSDFPTVRPFQAALRGDIDGFVAVFSPGGGDLDFSSYLGGSLTDLISGIALGSDYSICLGGSTISQDFPTVAPYQASLGGMGDYWGDAVVAVVEALATVPPTPTPSPTPPGYKTPTPSATPSSTPSATPTSSVTPTPTPAGYLTPTATPTASATPTVTPTSTPAYGTAPLTVSQAEGMALSRPRSPLYHGWKWTVAEAAGESWMGRIYDYSGEFVSYTSLPESVPVMVKVIGGALPPEVEEGDYLSFTYTGESGPGQAVGIYPPAVFGLQTDGSVSYYVAADGSTY